MSDIRISWSAADSRGDWVILPDGDLETGDDLATAILFSLFTDRVAGPDDVIPDGSADRRGWWGDEKIGSRLWLLDRAKQTEETRQRAADYIAEALQWLIDDGVVSRFDTTVVWVRNAMLGVRLVAYRSSGGTSTAAFDWAWKGSLA